MSCTCADPACGHTPGDVKKMEPCPWEARQFKNVHTGKIVVLCEPCAMDQLEAGELIDITEASA